MATFKAFEDIEAWQKARDLVRRVYHISQGSEFSRDYALKDQMRRAAISIMSNIAEGFERNGNKEFIHFLSIAKGSAGEVRSQLYVALDQRYIDKDRVCFIDRSSRRDFQIDGRAHELSEDKRSQGLEVSRKPGNTELVTLNS